MLQGSLMNQARFWFPAVTLNLKPADFSVKPRLRMMRTVIQAIDKCPVCAEKRLHFIVDFAEIVFSTEPFCYHRLVRYYNRQVFRGIYHFHRLTDSRNQFEIFSRSHI